MSTIGRGHNMEDQPDTTTESEQENRASARTLLE